MYYNINKRTENKAHKQLFESNDNFLIESEKYSTKKDFKEALNKSGLVVIHISTERDLYEK